MAFVIQDQVFDILEEIEDKIHLEVEHDYELDKDLIQMSLTLPKESYRKFGPEAAEMLQNFIENDPIGFIEYFFPGDFEELEFDQIEKEYTKIIEENNSLKIFISLCCVLDD